MDGMNWRELRMSYNRSLKSQIYLPASIINHGLIKCLLSTHHCAELPSSPLNPALPLACVLFDKCLNLKMKIIDVCVCWEIKYINTIVRSYLTIEFWPTNSAATSLGSKTTTSAVISPKQSGLSQQWSAVWIFALTSTQDQPEKTKFAPQTNYTDVPLLVSCSTPLCQQPPIRVPLKPSLFFHYKAFLLPCLPHASDGSRLLCYSKLGISPCLFSFGWSLFPQCSLFLLLSWAHLGPYPLAIPRKLNHSRLRWSVLLQLQVLKLNSGE